jgi:hypothetical protein
LISLSLLLSSHLRIFQHSRVRSSTACYCSFNLLKSRSPPLRVYCQRLVAHLALAFTSPPAQKALGLPLTITRRLIMQKASSHPAHLNSVQTSKFKVSGSKFKVIRHAATSNFQPWTLNPVIWPGAKWAGLLHIVCNRFQVYFTPLEGVLFTFPSRYLFTIGCQGVFSLIPWSGRIHAEFHVHRITWDSPRGFRVFAHSAFTVYGRLFHVATLTVHLPHRGPSTPGRQVLPV